MSHYFLPFLFSNQSLILIHATIITSQSRGNTYKKLERKKRHMMRKCPFLPFARLYMSINFVSVNY